MAYDSRVLRIFIASPSDVQSERQSIAKIIQEWNDAHSFNTKTVLLPLKWETHSAPDLKDTAQNIINEIVDQCDLAIGVFWTRIGSSTGKTISGTVEEIERVRNAKKPVMVYFSKAPIPTEADLMQVQKVRDFNTSIRSTGLFGEYNNINEFETAFKRHLIIKVNELIAASPNIPKSIADAEKMMLGTIEFFQKWANEQKTKEVLPEVIDVKAITEDLRQQLKKEIYEKANYNKQGFIDDVKKVVSQNGFPDQSITRVHKNILVRNTVFDFIIESPKRTYLVLIRAYDDHYQSQTTAKQLSNLTRSLTKNDLPVEISSTSNNLQPLIIAPSIVRFLGRQSSQIPILKFIIKDKTFKNWDDIREFLDSKEKIKY